MTVIIEFKNMMRGKIDNTYLIASVVKKVSGLVPSFINFILVGPANFRLLVSVMRELSTHSPKFIAKLALLCLSTAILNENEI